MKTIGRRIKTLEALNAAALARQSCVMRSKYGSFSKPCPAAFLINRIGHDLLRIFENGLFLYKPTKSRVVEGAYHAKAPKSSHFRYTPPPTLLLENKP